MAVFLFFTVLSLVAVAAAYLANVSAAGRAGLLVLSPVLFVVGFLIGSSVSIPSEKSGVVMKQIGPVLPTGQIIARNGEQGPQAKILGPGWHFGLLPFVYEVAVVDVAVIEHGKLGFITAKDGLPLGDNQTFAKPWESATDLLDPEVFLAKGGQRGPQTTVLTPGTYRYNPVLHDVKTVDALQVPPGSVAVIKSNTGPQTVVGPNTVSVNGVPLVNNGEQGIWKDPLKPGAYYLNTQAFVATLVKTTQRIYTYQMSAPKDKNAKAPATDWSVTVRSKDGFSFPVDVRVGCAVEAGDAAYLVALLGDPDRHVQDDQEDEDLEVLEARLVLPAVRAIFRNVAETMSALEFINARSQIEKQANERIRIELAKYRLTCDGVFVGNIHLDASEAGKKLILTQTDREVAVNQQTLYAEQKKAQDARATFVRAEEEAEQQRNLAKATYEVQVKEQQAKARAAEAKGEADYQTITGDGRAKAYEAMVKALGREQVAQLEMLKLVAEGKIQITPQVMVGAGGLNDALAGTILRQALPAATGAAK